MKILALDVVNLAILLVAVQHKGYVKVVDDQKILATYVVNLVILLAVVHLRENQHSQHLIIVGDQERARPVRREAGHLRSNHQHDRLEDQLQPLFVITSNTGNIAKNNNIST